GQARGVGADARRGVRASRRRTVSADGVRHASLAHVVLQRTSAFVSSTLRLSIAIPVFNEEHVLPELLARLRGVLDEVPGGPHEIVFVDDGSRDRTFEILTAEAAADSRIMAIALSRNFGHQMAITAALDHVSGDVV